MKFLGHSRPANHLAALEHPHLHPLSGQIKRAGQAIVATADYNGIIRLGHENSF
jgi:hypothetical protein